MIAITHNSQTLLNATQLTSKTTSTKTAYTWWQENLGHCYKRAKYFVQQGRNTFKVWRCLMWQRLILQITAESEGERILKRGTVWQSYRHLGCSGILLNGPIYVPRCTILLVEHMFKWNSDGTRSNSYFVTIQNCGLSQWDQNKMQVTSRKNLQIAGQM